MAPERLVSLQVEADFEGLATRTEQLGCLQHIFWPLLCSKPAVLVVDNQDAAFRAHPARGLQGTKQHDGRGEALRELRSQRTS